MSVPWESTRPPATPLPSEKPSITALETPENAAVLGAPRESSPIRTELTTMIGVSARPGATRSPPGQGRFRPVAAGRAQRHPDKEQPIALVGGQAPAARAVEQRTGDSGHRKYGEDRSGLARAAAGLGESRDREVEDAEHDSQRGGRADRDQERAVQVAPGMRGRLRLRRAARLPVTDDGARDRSNPEVSTSARSMMIAVRALAMAMISPETSGPRTKADSSRTPSSA